VTEHRPSRLDRPHYFLVFLFWTEQWFVLRGQHGWQVERKMANVAPHDSVVIFAQVHLAANLAMARSRSGSEQQEKQQPQQQPAAPQQRSRQPTRLSAAWARYTHTSKQSSLKTVGWRSRGSSRSKRQRAGRRQQQRLVRRGAAWGQVKRRQQRL
jgi:hypothetical protein